jgi:hypothetical protein
VRLIQKWLSAGVLENGKRAVGKVGSPQGATISPLLRLPSLHLRPLVLEQGAEQWRRRHARGDMIIVRYADDIVVGFQHEQEARRFWAACALGDKGRATPELWSGAAPRQDSLDRVRSPCEPRKARRRETGSIRLPWLHASMRRVKEERKRFGWNGKRSSNAYGRRSSGYPMRCAEIVTAPSQRKASGSAK